MMLNINSVDKVDGTGLRHLRTEATVQGAKLTWDSEARCGYLNMRPDDPAVIPTTVDLGGGVLIDIDPNCNIRGVEMVGDAVTVWTLAAVLRRCTFHGS